MGEEPREGPARARRKARAGSPSATEPTGPSATEPTGPSATEPTSRSATEPTSRGKRARAARHRLSDAHTGRWVGVLALLVVVLVVVLTFVGDPGGISGIPPGQRLAPFAVPLATSTLRGDANVATRAHEGEAGNVPACSVRLAGALNICALYERGPVVLALFVDGGSCPSVLAQMQRLAPQFAGVQFAAVAIEGNSDGFDGERARLRALVRREGLTLPVGIDADGALATIYKVVSCPQLNFAYPGGTVQSKALLVAPSLPELHARVAALVAASEARGWRART